MSWFGSHCVMCHECVEDYGSRNEAPGNSQNLGLGILLLI